MSVVVVALLLVSCGSSSPKDVTNSYYKALQKGDYEKALSYTTAVDDKDEIQKEIKKMEGLDVKIPEYEIVSEESVVAQFGAKPDGLVEIVDGNGAGLGVVTALQP